MDLQSNLIESTDRKQKGAGKFSIASLGLHALIVAFILFMSASASHRVAAEQPIRAYLAQGVAPPPPPPPPPPPAGSSVPKPTPTIKPVVVPHQSFVQPTEIPKELPKVSATTTPAADLTPASSQPAGGEPGGVPGGVVGGVVGGVQGGVVGGQIGGVLGGTLGGVPGGTGEAKEPPPPPPPPKPEGPLRVGGEVKAPVVTRRVEPQYTEIARKGRITGVVIVEAIIDKNGNVDHVKVLRGLSMGLSEQAENAVRQWKFRPGTLNGEPVDVIFNLVVNFTLDGMAKVAKPPEATSTE